MSELPLLLNHIDLIRRKKLLGKDEKRKLSFCN